MDEEPLPDYATALFFWLKSIDDIHPLSNFFTYPLTLSFFLSGETHG